MKFDKDGVVTCKKDLAQSMKVYAVTDRAWVGEETLYEQVEKALKGGATFIQLREKELDEESFLKEALEIQELCRKYKVPFVVNDNVEIAKKIGADGVHVGQSDMEAADVRELLGEDKIIGVSAQTVEQALLAESRGADYLGVGAVFHTNSKDDADDVSHETLRAICEAVKIPVVAIGGISKDNVMELAGSGIDGIAVISAIFGQKEIEKATKDLCCVTEKMLCNGKKLTGVIFDIDGTLLDSMMIWKNVGGRYLESIGVTPDENLSKELASMTLEQASEHIRVKYGLSQNNAQIREGVLGIVADFYMNDAQLKPGVKELLEALSAKNVPMVLATTGERRLARAALERNGVWQYFTELFTASELATSKKEPMIFEKAAKAIGSPIETTMVVEDSLYALQTAVRDGFFGVGLWDAYSEKHWNELRNLADISLDGMEEYPRLLELF